MTRAALALALVAGCASGSDTTDAPDRTDTFNLDTGLKTTPAALAEMRVVNLAVGEPPAKLHVDNRENAVLTDLDPLEGSIWRQITAGERVFRVGPEGGDEDSEWARLEATIEPEERYTLVLFGSGSDIELLSFADDARSIPEDEARYSMMNASADLDPFDVLDIDDKKDPVLAESLPYGKGPSFTQKENAERTMGVDLNGDGTAEAEFTVPDAGPRVVMPVYFLVDLDGFLIMAGQAPQGKVRVQTSTLEIPPRSGGTGTP